MFCFVYGFTWCRCFLSARDRKTIFNAKQKPVMNKQQRRAVLMPDGIPKYIRCYDNGGRSFDRYTVVFTGRYTHKTGGAFLYLGMSENPFHPQGFGQHGESQQRIDYPKYSHIGKPIPFNALPEKCRELVLADYADIWDPENHHER
jgi:hypothetical protein